ncbi:MAG: UDP-3-O-(3-hydroxymyristoyl)glucosamine N-acyltransferase [Elusimicrobia bacterium]|nr:UDP-3-O-(3-hydroxymyristoyl)glucosamine N-acyltransferase [Elusimicrobiota bacterium]
MGKNLLSPVRASHLSRALGLELLGEDREIRELCGLEALSGHGLSFSLDRSPGAASSGTVFASEPSASSSLTVLRADKPRLEFIRAQHLLQESPGFEEDSAPPDIHPTARIGLHAVIESGVRIGEGTRVGSLAVIKSGTRIGRRCDIKSGAVIGESGFGFERDGANRALRMIHIGRVVIGDHVEIGSLTTVCRGALGDTVIEDHVKIDDHCHISHNCRIGEGAMITACVAVSGSVAIGRDAWLAPGCALVQKLSVGAGAFIGIGAVVTRSVPARARVFGNPAKPIPVLGAPAEGRRHGSRRKDR